MVGRICIRDGPHAARRLRTTALKVHTVLVPNTYIQIFKLYIYLYLWKGTMGDSFCTFYWECFTFFLLRNRKDEFW